MIKNVSRNDLRKKRHLVIRKSIRGNSLVPRLNVFRSNKNIFANLIDDEEGKTLVSASTLELKLKNGSNQEAAIKVGELIAQKALQTGYKKVVFDRSGYLYHGRVKALAEAARSKGLEF